MRPNRDLRGRTVVITGGSSGIGRACALEFGAAGCTVVISGRRPEPLAQTRAELEARGVRCLAVPTDVRSREQVYALRDAALAASGKLDIWVNNAGYGMVARFEELCAEDLEAIWRTNLMGSFHGCQAALEPMRRQGHGHIMNVSSLAGRYALPLNAAYAASKHALNALGQSLGAELEGSGIDVTTVMPGLTDTGFFAAMVDKVGPTGTHLVRAMPAEVVARAMVRCARRPRERVVFAPGGAATLALAEVFPIIFRTIARQYVKVRLSGRKE
ncbi:MAG: SDR family NAD(P)-dependent oxidoreductase [Armatimonadetes bacterium]|nr:SDR family NAD(P)-dependent oxidoreductase [Armatimonadota bacterium]